MSHWAEIDGNNIVMRVLVGQNNEDDGKSFFDSLEGKWIQTSYNSKIRKNFASQGYSYDEILDAFIPPKNNCHAEEFFNQTTCTWNCLNEIHKLNAKF